MPALTLTCRGARGSVPVSGDQFRQFGGATTCYEIGLTPDHRLLIDAGTGALSLHDELGGQTGLHVSLLLTHLHWDHTLALPFFRPLYDAATTFDIYGHSLEDMGLEEAIDRVMRPPWFPVSFRSTPAAKQFYELDGWPLTVGDVDVTWTRLNHPQGVTAYRLTRGGHSIVVATDVEHGEPEFEAEVLELARGADVLVYDAQYLPQEYVDEKVGWGHSTWVEAVKLARDADVGRLVLTSHDPSRTDDEVAEIEAMARAEFPDTDAAYEGMVVEV